MADGDQTNPEPEAVRIVRVSADIVLPLRHAVLRTGRAWSDAFYPADENPLTAHMAAVRDTPGGRQVLCVGSILAEAPSWQGANDGSEGSDVEGFAWRIRGMAARSDSRSLGLGGRVLRGLLAHAEAQGESQPTALAWCSAREPAIGFYERHGFNRRGEIATVAGLGPHLTMWRKVVADLPSGH